MILEVEVDYVLRNSLSDGTFTTTKLGGHGNSKKKQQGSLSGKITLTKGSKFLQDLYEL